jgi:hypothetical protein
MKTIAVSLLLSVMTLLAVPESVWASDGVKTVKSYREWKNQKVQEAQGRLTTYKTRLDRKKDPNLNKIAGTEARDLESLRLENQVRSEQNALETAKELTVSDYFAGYLIRLRDKNGAFKEVAGRLTAEEVAELMAAYANSVFGTQTGNLPASANNVGVESMK